jgi:nucleotide-binding universal stress UspA family protein
VGIARAARVTEPDPTGPVIVGVDGSERSIDALVLADRLGAALRRPVVIAYVHPYGELASLFSEGDYERLVREVAESTFDQIREHLPSVPERRLQLVTEASPAGGLHAMAEREGASLTVIGSSSRSRIGHILVGGTGERLLSGASAPVAVAPAGYAATAGRLGVVGCGFDGSRESRRALAWTGRLARTTSARLLVLSVYERTLPASLAVGGGLPTASINDVLRRQFEERVASAVSELHADIDASQRLLDGDAQQLLARESGDLDLLVVGSRGYGPLRAVLLGSVSSALVRSAQSPLVVVPRAADGEPPQGTMSPRRMA